MKSLNKVLCVLSILLLISVSAWAGEVQDEDLTVFVSGEKAVASEVNGNFNAVKTAVNDNAGAISTNASGIEALETNIGTTDISTLESDVATNAADITDIDEKLNILWDCAYGRFCDLQNGTIRDNKTGLIWLKNANCFGPQNWDDAVAEASGLNHGDCGLTDESVEGDWRLPTKNELEGIGTNPPTTWDSGAPPVTWTMPGTPFSDVQSSKYWSSIQNGIKFAWYVYMNNGDVNYELKDDNNYVWPVRSDD